MPLLLSLSLSVSAGLYESDIILLLSAASERSSRVTVVISQPGGLDGTSTLPAKRGGVSDIPCV